METYVILRRRGWQSVEQFDEADRRSVAESEWNEEVARIRSYVLDEQDGSVGTVCVYQASSPEAARRHAAAAGLPVDEIVKVADTRIRDLSPPRSRRASDGAGGRK